MIILKRFFFNLKLKFQCLLFKLVMYSETWEQFYKHFRMHTFSKYCSSILTFFSIKRVQQHIYFLFFLHFLVRAICDQPNELESTKNERVVAQVTHTKNFSMRVNCNCKCFFFLFYTSVSETLDHHSHHWNSSKSQLCIRTYV